MQDIREIRKDLNAAWNSLQTLSEVFHFHHKPWCAQYDAGRDCDCGFDLLTNVTLDKMDRAMETVEAMEVYDERI